MGDAINVILKEFESIKIALYVIYSHASDFKSEVYLNETEKRLLDEIENSAGDLIDSLNSLKNITE